MSFLQKPELSVCPEAVKSRRHKKSSLLKTLLLVPAAAEKENKEVKQADCPEAKLAVSSYMRSFLLHKLSKSIFYNQTKESETCTYSYITHQ